jgi:hypothetical protein
MSIYDCGDPDCETCARRYADRTQAIAEFLKREAFLASLPREPVRETPEQRAFRRFPINSHKPRFE